MIEKKARDSHNINNYRPISRVRTHLFPIHIICYYNPPTESISIEFFKKLKKLKAKFIIGRDLNSKKTDFGCKKNNKNGEILQEQLDQLNTVIVNDHTPTFTKADSEYMELLDLFITSRELHQYVKKFEVDDINLTTRDHFPIHMTLDFNIPINDQTPVKKLNFGLANWLNFKRFLQDKTFLCRILIKK
jgi:hypothetical protein